jgi:ribose transport system substrate-binding protein
MFIDWINSKSVDQIKSYPFIFTHDDEIAMGILEALSGTEIEKSKKDAFLASVTSLGTSSGLNEMYEVLKGEHSNTAYPDIIKNFDLFSVTYDPAMIKQAIQDMVSYLDGEDVSKDDTISVNVVDATNVSEYQGF